MGLSSVTTPSPLIAEEDIVCFKLAYPDSECDQIAVSAVREHEYVLGALASSPLELVEEKHPYYTGYTEHSISKGIHSFVSLDSTYAYMHYARCIFKEGVTIYRCVIPKGSKYYFGTFANRNCYASDRLIMVRPVTKWEIVKSRISNFFFDIFGFVYVS